MAVIVDGSERHLQNPRVRAERESERERASERGRERESERERASCLRA